MRRKPRRERDFAGLSFLDCICCGFGAIILLLIVVKIRQPVLLEDIGAELMNTVAALRASLEDLLQETEEVEEELALTKDEIEEEKPDLERANADWARISAQLAKIQANSEFLKRMNDIYARAQESEGTGPPSSLVGGVPADSEYIIFVIDTSGSMIRFNWENAIQKIEETLDVHPRVKGIQVMNDMGNYMFSSYKGKWIPDTDRGRKIILNYLRSWRSFSNSSPVEGITAAIQMYGQRVPNLSIYVFGDEFTGPSIQDVVDTVDRLNRRKRVRIHAVGFSVIDPRLGGLPPTIRRFSTLMRVLCQRNGGTFVALQPG